MNRTVNVLSYESTDNNGLSFELLVDGKLLREVIGSPNGPIPYWLFLPGIDLPAFDTQSMESASRSRIVTVCDCGEAGCGHTECEVAREGEAIKFRSFRCEISEESQKMKFLFTLANYDTVSAEIVRKSHEYARSHLTAG